MADVLNVEKREERGTLRMRRLRRAGRIPAILYGHGEENVCLAVSARELNHAIGHGAHVVELRGAVHESALIKKVQWDQVGSDVLHLDLTRVDASESVEVSVAIELRGDAPGTHQGGMLKMLAYDIEIRCRVSDIPDKLALKVNQLDVGGALTAAEIELPPGAELVGSPDEIVVQCVMATPVEEEEEAAVEGAEVATEPEVIGRHKEEESEEEAS